MSGAAVAVMSIVDLRLCWVVALIMSFVMGKSENFEVFFDCQYNLSVKNTTI